MSASQPTNALGHDHIVAIELCARIMSTLSLVGSCFIISTFLCFAPFRKPINRLVFYATWGNIMTNVATLISTAAIPSDPDRLSPFCEFQGILIQWFVMADSLWVFCMAVNVLLVFWYGYDAQQLRHLEKWYALFAYGIPGIPSIVYIILDHHSQTRIIGSATLWCWVAEDVDWMRLAFFYGPVWIVVIATLVIYIITGIRIFKKRALLKQFLRQPKPMSNATALELRVAASEGILVTREIHHEVYQQSIGHHSTSTEGDHGSRNSHSSTQNLSRADRLKDIQELPLRDGIHRASSYEHSANFQHGFRTTIVATASQPKESSMLPPRPSSAATHHNAAAWAYFRVSFLMFVALFVVWVPSSANRLYEFINKDRASFSLSIVSAIVLPLQGTWNATIYIYTTRSEFGRASRVIKSRLTGKRIGYRPSRSLLRKGSRAASNSVPDSPLGIQPGVARGPSGGLQAQRH